MHLCNIGLLRHRIPLCHTEGPQCFFGANCRSGPITTLTTNGAVAETLRILVTAHVESSTCILCFFVGKFALDHTRQSRESVMDGRRSICDCYRHGGPAIPLTQ